MPLHASLLGAHDKSHVHILRSNRSLFVTECSSLNELIRKRTGLLFCTDLYKSSFIHVMYHASTLDLRNWNIFT